VSGHQIGEPESLFQVGQEIEDLGSDGYVQRRHGLIEDDEPGVTSQRPRHCDALPLAAAELVGIEACAFQAQPYVLQQLCTRSLISALGTVL
jgi:hypothetical protein